MRSERELESPDDAGSGRPARRYGAAVGSSPAICDFAARIATLAEALPPEEVPGAVAGELRSMLSQPGLLGEGQRAPLDFTYARHVLYADPLRRFTILALVWLPGQGTPVHGHTAWGAMGVYEGELTVTNYVLTSSGLPALECHPGQSLNAGPGVTAGVLPGLGDIHRITNDSARPAISIHIYGKDLLQDPASLNIVLSH